MPLRAAILTLQVDIGLAIDAEILRSVLTRIGWSAKIFDVREKPPADFAGDCSFFLERFNARWAGRFNVFVPNPEFILPKEVATFRRFEWIACKTQHTLQLMKVVAPDRAGYIGWTCPDRFRKPQERYDDECLHIAGHSNQKGTEALLAAWAVCPHFPMLHVVDWRKNVKPPPKRRNIHPIGKRISDLALAKLMNRCGIHICPSIAEGFGHTLHEAMSCGAVLMTTDAPPMNEQGKDCSILIPPAKQTPLGITTANYVKPSAIAAAVEKVLAMSDSQRRQLGRRARTRWEQNRKNFLQAIENAAKIIERHLTRRPGVMRVEKPLTLGTNSFRA